MIIKGRDSCLVNSRAIYSSLRLLEVAQCYIAMGSYMSESPSPASNTGYIIFMYALHNKEDSRLCTDALLERHWHLARLDQVG